MNDTQRALWGALGVSSWPTQVCGPLRFLLLCVVSAYSWRGPHQNRTAQHSRSPYNTVCCSSYTLVQWLNEVLLMQVVVSPSGKVLFSVAGECHAQDIEDCVSAALEYYGEAGALTTEPLPLVRVIFSLSVHLKIVPF